MGVAGLMETPGRMPAEFDLRHQSARIATRLYVEDERFASGARNSFDIRVGILDHEMNMEWSGR